MFKLHIHHPKKENEDFNNIHSILFTSFKGEYEVLTNHEPFFTTFLPPILRIQKEGEAPQTIEVTEIGFLKFEENACDIWLL